MKINFILFFIAAVLGFIYFYFSPEKITFSKKSTILANVEVENFILYQFDTEKLSDITVGKRLEKYPTYYRFLDFHLQDNRGKNLVDLSGKEGLFKNDILKLSDDVVYTTDDGLVFHTQEIEYNRKTQIVQNHSNFFLTYQTVHHVKGKKLHYNINTEELKAYDINASYELGK